LTTLVYRIPPGLSEREVAIFIKMLIQKTNRFNWTPTSSEIGELVSVYTILSDEKNLKELQNFSEWKIGYHLSFQ